MFKRQNKLNNLSIEELEQALRIKQREARQERFTRLSAQGASRNAALLAAENPHTLQAAPPAPKASNAGLMQTPLMVSLGKRGKPSAPSQTQHSPAPKKRLRDLVLLSLEVGAVVGLAAILLISYLNFKELNQEVVEARDVSRFAAVISERLGAQPVAEQAQPTLNFSQLPGGHSSPISEGGATPDIPAYLQNWAQPTPAIPAPRQNAAIATRIVIPEINVDAPIIKGVTWEDLKKGVGHLPGSAQPGQRGNLYLAAHNDIFGDIFRYLDDLEAGDEYYIYAGDAKFTYVVREKRIIDPTEVSVMLPTTEPVATLQTCYPYLIDTHRLVVVSDLVK